MQRARYKRRLAIFGILLLTGVLAAPAAAGTGKKGPSRRVQTTTTTTTVRPTTTTTAVPPTTTTTAPPAPTTTVVAPTTPSTRPTVRVADYGTTTARIQAAADAARGGVLVFEPGAVHDITAPIRLPSDVVVVGNGATLRTASGTTTPSTSDGILDIVGVTGVEVSGLTFDGNSGGQGAWSQWRHAVRVLDASQVRIHDNRFVNLIGDGVYVSHRLEAAAPYRCSTSIEVVDNTFSADHDNRNGVSLVCGAQLSIRGNRFLRMARPDMPGSIDLEPNRAEEFLEDVEIAGNHIESGDGAYTPSGILYLDQGAGARVAGVSVHHNTIRGPQLKYGIAFYGQYERSRVSGVTIWSNDIRNIRYSSTAVGITIEQGVPATVSGNVVDGVTGWGILTYRSCVSVGDNQVENVTLGLLKHLEPTC